MLAAPGWGCSQVSDAAVMIRLSQSRWFPWRRHLSRCACQHLHHHPQQKQLATLDRTEPSGSDRTESSEAVDQTPVVVVILVIVSMVHYGKTVTDDSYWVLVFSRDQNVSGTPYLIWIWGILRHGHNPQALPAARIVQGFTAENRG